MSLQCHYTVMSPHLFHQPCRGTWHLAPGTWLPLPPPHREPSYRLVELAAIQCCKTSLVMFEKTTCTLTRWLHVCSSKFVPLPCSTPLGQSGPLALSKSQKSQSIRGRSSQVPTPVHTKCSFTVGACDRQVINQWAHMAEPDMSRCRMPVVPINHDASSVTPTRAPDQVPANSRRQNHREPVLVVTSYLGPCGSTVGGPNPSPSW